MGKDCKYQPMEKDASLENYVKIIQKKIIEI